MGVGGKMLVMTTQLSHASGTPGGAAGGGENGSVGYCAASTAPDQLLTLDPSKIVPLDANENPESAARAVWITLTKTSSHGVLPKTMIMTLRVLEYYCRPFSRVNAKWFHKSGNYK